MTPQLALEPHTTAAFSNKHLTEDQVGELLAQAAGTASASAEAHLLACEQCAADLALMRESLSLFRQASITHADSELRHLPLLSFPAQGILSLALQRAYLATAAAALFLAALLPIQGLRQHAFRPSPAASAGVASSPAESDEALLDDVNRDVSASVPAPMQALADPTDGIPSASTDPSLNASDQRKY